MSNGYRKFDINHSCSILCNFCGEFEEFRYGGLRRAYQEGWLLWYEADNSLGPEIESNIIVCCPDCIKKLDSALVKEKSQKFEVENFL